MNYFERVCVDCGREFKTYTDDCHVCYMCNDNEYEDDID